MDNLFGQLFSKMKRGMGLAPLEQLARSAGAPALFPPMGTTNMTPENYNKKHGASPAKILPGIGAASAKLGERPIGGKQPNIPAQPLFMRRTS